MEHEPIEHTELASDSLQQQTKRPRHRSSHVYLIVLASIVAIAVAVGIYLLIINNSTRKDANTEQVLTVSDLDNPDVNLNPETSDASVTNLTQELKAKIDSQIANKENPFGTVQQLALVLEHTTNSTRPDQLVDFIENFLADHESALWFEDTNGDAPDQAQVNHYKSQLYSLLVQNYEFMMLNEFVGTDGKPVDTTADQLKYIDLYLALDNDPASHPPIPEEDQGIFDGYVYDRTEDFLELKSSLAGGGAV